MAAGDKSVSTLNTVTAVMFYWCSHFHFENEDLSGWFSAASCAIYVAVYLFFGHTVVKVTTQIPHEGKVCQLPLEEECRAADSHTETDVRGKHQRKCKRYSRESEGQSVSGGYFQ